ncbi:Uncharacterised protein [Segatella copri]|nr:Uncharacterised protein [Segatella copri]
MRAEESGGLLREIETAHLIIYNHRLRVILLRTDHLIFVGNIVVAYMEMQGHGILLGIEESDGSLINILFDVAFLDTGHVVRKMLLCSFHRTHGKMLGEVAIVGYQSQGRRFKHLLAIQLYRIESLSVYTFHLDRQSAVR